MHTKHVFVSGKADGTDATLVKPSNWNADHDMTTDADGVVLGRAAGAGAGTVQELPFGAVLPYGTVLPFAGPTSPSGWLICDGSSLLRATYPGLFAVIGTAYGAVDGAHFSIPDLRGRTIAGLDPTGTRLTNATILPNGNTLGAVGGQQTEAAGVSGSASVSVSGSISGTAHGYLGGTVSDGAGTSGQSNIETDVTLAVGGSFSGSGSGSISGATAAVTNMPPTLLMNWIIKT